MKEIKAYKLSNGKIVESRAEAEAAEREIACINAVNDFAERNGVYDSKDAIRNAILENADELKKILNAR